MAVQESDEILTRAEIVDGSRLDGTAVTGGVSDADVTMSVIAIRRPTEGWILVADDDAELRGGISLSPKEHSRPPSSSVS